MRLVFPLLLLLLGVVVFGFVLANTGERVTIKIWDTEYPDVSLWQVALVALTLGVTFTAVVALVEGAAIRLANRRLRGEVQRLETENRFLRSQQGPPRLPPEQPAEVAEAIAPRARSERLPPADAPVYEPEEVGEEEAVEVEEDGEPS
jgi:hypothetical protein